MATVGERLKEIRADRSINQEQLAKLLGITRSAVSEIERGDRRLSAEELSRLARALSVSADYVLGIAEKPEVTLQNDEEGERVEKTRLRVSVPQKNVTKFKEALLYITSQVGARPNVGETVIFKLLYFMDFDYYEKYEEQLLGATYQRSPYGPTPVEFEAIVRQMIDAGEIDLVTRHYHGHEQKKYLPARNPNLSVFTGQEIELMDDVIRRLAHMGARQISDYSHQDVPWLTTDNGEIIPYESVFYRTAAYSVRDDGDEDEVSRG